MGVMLERAYPSVFWPELGVIASFAPNSELPADSEHTAVIAFAWTGEGFLLCDIPGRGWCAPSGRVEAGESAAAAAVREAREEARVDLLELIVLGTYDLTDSE